MAVIREQRQFKIGPIGIARASQGLAMIATFSFRPKAYLAKLGVQAGFQTKWSTGSPGRTKAGTTWPSSSPRV